MKSKFNFDSFRRWFNQMFSLSFNGKFKGLSTLVSLYGMRFVEHFSYRLSKVLRHYESGYLHGREVIVIKLSGSVIKLYSR